MKDFEQTSGKSLDDDNKMAVLQHKLAPPEVVQHLFLNAATILTYEQMKTFIEDYIESRVGQDSSAMEMSALFWDQDKGRFHDPKKPDREMNKW